MRKLIFVLTIKNCFEGNKATCLPKEIPFEVDPFLINLNIISLPSASKKKPPKKAERKILMKKFVKLCLKACLIAPSKDSESSIDFAISSLDFNLQDIQKLFASVFFSSFIPFVSFFYFSVLFSKIAQKEAIPREEIKKINI